MPCLLALLRVVWCCAALVLVINTCCDLIGASFQTSRQLEALAALLTALAAASSAVLTQLAAWALPKFMQIME